MKFPLEKKPRIQISITRIMKEFYVGLVLLVPACIQPGFVEAKTCTEIWIPGNFLVQKQSTVPTDVSCPDYSAWVPTFYPAIRSEEALPTESDVIPIGSMTVGGDAELIWPFDIEIGPDMTVRASSDAILTLEGGSDISHMTSAQPSRGVTLIGNSTLKKTGEETSVIKVPINAENNNSFASTVIASQGRLELNDTEGFSRLGAVEFIGDIVVRSGDFRGGVGGNDGLIFGDLEWHSGHLSDIRLFGNNVVGNGASIIIGRSEEAIFGGAFPGNLVISERLVLNGDGIFIQEESSATAEEPRLLRNIGIIDKVTGEGDASIGQGLLRLVVDPGSLIRSQSGSYIFNLHRLDVNAAEMDTGPGAMSFEGDGDRFIENSNLNGDFNFMGAGVTQITNSTINGAVNFFGGETVLNGMPPISGLVTIGSGIFTSNIAPLEGNFLWLGGKAKRLQIGTSDPLSALIRIPHNDSLGIGSLVIGGTTSIEGDADFVCSPRYAEPCGFGGRGIIRKNSGTGTTRIGEGNLDFSLRRVADQPNSGSLVADTGIIELNLSEGPPNTVIPNQFEGANLAAMSGEIHFVGNSRMEFSDSLLEGNIILFDTTETRFHGTQFNGNIRLLDGEYEFVDTAESSNGLSLEGGRFGTRGIDSAGLAGNSYWSGGVADGLVNGGPNLASANLKLNAGEPLRISVEDLANYGTISIEESGVLVAAEVDNFGGNTLENYGTIVRQGAAGVSQIGEGELELDSEGGSIVANAGVLALDVGGEFIDSSIIGDGGQIRFNGQRPQSFDNSEIGGDVVFMTRAIIENSVINEGVRFGGGAVFQNIASESGPFIFEGGRFDSSDAIQGEIEWIGGQIGALTLGVPNEPDAGQSKLTLFPSDSTRIVLELINRATIHGEGNIQGNGSLINHGVLSPGNPETALGMIVTSAGVVPESEGNVRLDIADDGNSDRIIIEGFRPIELKGQLMVRLASGSTGEFGSAGEEFDLIESSSISGAFDTVVLPPAGPFETQYDLSIVSTPDNREVLRLTASSAEVSVLPGCVDLGDQPLGAMVTSDFLIIENRGFSELSVSSVAIEGTDSGDFSISSPSDDCTGSNLPDGDFCGFQIEYTPSGPGLREAQAVIETSAPNSPHSINLQGTNDVLFIDNFSSETCQ